jgi:MerC mercury resistance protein
MLSTLIQRFGLDRLALGLSALCLVHCVASIVLVATLASGGHLLDHPAWHQIGLGLAIFFAALGLIGGFRRHGERAPLMIGGFGLAFMVAALVVPHGLQEAALTIFGVSVVAAAHFKNIRLRTCAA